MRDAEGRHVGWGIQVAATGVHGVSKSQQEGYARWRGVGGTRRGGQEAEGRHVAGGILVAATDVYGVSKRQQEGCERWRGVGGMWKAEGRHVGGAS